MKKGNDILVLGVLAVGGYLAFKLFGGGDFSWGGSGGSSGSGVVGGNTLSNALDVSGSLAKRVVTTNAFVTRSPQGTALFQYPGFGIVRNYPSATPLGFNFLPPPGVPYAGPPPYQSGAYSPHAVTPQVVRGKGAYAKPGGM